MIMATFEKRPDVEERYARSEPLKTSRPARRGREAVACYAPIALPTSPACRCRSMAVTWLNKSGLQGRTYDGVPIVMVVIGEVENEST